ncbi:MAG: hypothetical protein AAF483_00585 [Planctomycetota bacterium]
MSKAQALCLFLANVSAHVQQGRIYLASNRIEQAKTKFSTVLAEIEPIVSRESSLLQVQTHLLLAKAKPSVPIEHVHVAGNNDFMRPLGPPEGRGGFRPGGPNGRPRRNIPESQRDELGERKRGERQKRNVEHRRLATLHATTALSILDELMKASPNSESLRYLRALCLQQLAGPGLIDENDPNDQGKMAVDILKQLCEESKEAKRGSSLPYQFELSETYRNFNARQLDEFSIDPAKTQLHKAREISESLVEQHDQVALYRINLAHIYANLSMLYERQRDLRTAELYSRKAVDAHHFVAKHFPGLKSISRSLLAGPSFALSRMLRNIDEDLDALIVLATLEKELKKQIADPNVDEALKEKAAKELEVCEKLMEEIDL